MHDVITMNVIKNEIRSIQDFQGQGTLDSWRFGILGPPIFMLARILDSRPQSGPVRGSKFVAKTF